MRRKKYKSNVNNNLRTVVVTMSIMMFLTITGFYLFNWYIHIDIAKPDNNQYIAEKTAQTVTETKNENKKIVDIIEEVSNCVVGISKLKDNGNSIFLQDASTSLGLGTGILISSDGYILTNEHVAGDKYSSCYVTLKDGNEYKANVLWADSDLDLAIIKINAKKLQYVTLGDSDNVRVGEEVYAIGNPIGFEFQRTVTSGIISAVNRTIKIVEEEKSSYMEDLIQTDATINPGNSGGPLIDIYGNVIGVNSIKITSAEGIGFAIPINIVKPIIESYQREGKFEEATLGIFAYDKEVIPYLDSNLKIENGIYIIDVVTNGAAAKAGLKEKDIIIQIDDLKLNKMTELRRYIYEKKPNDEVTLIVLRKGSIKTVKTILGRK